MAWLRLSHFSGLDSGSSENGEVARQPGQAGGRVCSGTISNPFGVTVLWISVAGSSPGTRRGPATRCNELSNGPCLLLQLPSAERRNCSEGIFITGPPREPPAVGEEGNSPPSSRARTAFFLGCLPSRPLTGHKSQSPGALISTTTKNTWKTHFKYLQSDLEIRRILSININRSQQV